MDADSAARSLYADTAFAALDSPTIVWPAPAEATDCVAGAMGESGMFEPGLTGRAMTAAALSSMFAVILIGSPTNSAGSSEISAAVFTGRTAGAVGSAGTFNGSLASGAEIVVWFSAENDDVEDASFSKLLLSPRVATNVACDTGARCTR